MKTLKAALFSKKNLNSNPYGLTEEDLKGDLKGFPMGVVVRMLEEQELQGNKPDVKVFQKDNISGNLCGGFLWDETQEGWEFWNRVTTSKDFNLFFERYPEYEMYNIS